MSFRLYSKLFVNNKHKHKIDHLNERVIINLILKLEHNKSEMIFDRSTAPILQGRYL